MKLSFGSKKKFIMTIGDDGAILTLIEKNKVLLRKFAISHSTVDRKEIHSIFLSNPTIPITVLLDTSEQTFIKQTLPGVSSLSIGKIATRRLERDFAKTDLKGALQQGQEKTGRKDWFYMFVSTPATPNIIGWLEYFATLQNNLVCISLLPMEMENVANDINKILFKDEKKSAEQEQWQLIVTHNKVSGFRQTILNEGKVIFTRLIRHGKDNLPDIIAGNIEQEIINTIDYLRRLGLGDNKPIDVIVIVSNELKVSLATIKIRGKPLTIYTPFDISTMLGYNNPTVKSDHFSDIIISAIIANHKPILKLTNPRAKGLDILLLVYKISSILVIGVIPVSIIYSLVIVYDIINQQSKLKISETKKANAETAWKNVKNSGNYSIDEANKITDAIYIRNKISEERRDPIDFLEKFADINADFLLLQSITWNYDKEYAEQGKKFKMSSILNVDFITKESNIEAMFKNYDILSEALNKKYNNFLVEVSKLPDQITFDNKTNNITIHIKFTSKDKEDAPPPPAPGLREKGGI